MVNQSQFIEKTTTSSSPLISLKEVVSIVRKNVNPTSGKTYTLYSFPAYDNQQIPEIVDGGEIRSCKLDLTPNTVLYNKLNVRLCRVWNIREIATTNNICSTEFIPLKMDESVLLQEYLVYFLTSEAVTKAMVGVSQGTSNSQKRIAPEALLKLEIPLPPTEVQKEFVAVYRKSDKSKFAGFKSQFIARFGTTECSPFPVKFLREISLSSGEYGANTPATKYNPEVGRYIRITDIDEFGNLNNDIVSPEVAENKYLLQKGDLLFARTGATVGKTYLHKEGKALYAGYLIKYRFTDAVLPDFVFAYTHSQEYYQWVELTQKVGAQPNISAKQYDGLKIIVPPIEEQKSFVALMHQADKSKFELKQAIEKIDKVMRALMS